MVYIGKTPIISGQYILNILAPDGTDLYQDHNKIYYLSYINNNQVFWLCSSVEWKLYRQPDYISRYVIQKWKNKIFRNVIK